MRFRHQISNLILIVATAAACDSGESFINTTGQGGSLTRFAIHQNYFYVATASTIGVYNIAANNFEHVKDVTVDFGLETIFTHGDFLYLGSRNAMYIYSITKPANPSFIFRYEHIVSCDPVVVQGNRAYVTLRSGTACNLGVNALEILDISNPMDPLLLANKPMTSPGGLGIEGNCLFICEGVNGLKLLNVADPKDIKELNAIETINAYDVIVKDGVATVTGEDGIFQYTFDCASGDMTLSSTIPVQRAEL